MLNVMVFINTLIIVCFITTANRLTKEMAHTAVLLGVLSLTWYAFTIVFRSFWALFLLAILYTMGNSSACRQARILRAEMMNENKLGTYQVF